MSIRRFRSWAKHHSLGAPNPPPPPILPPKNILNNSSGLISVSKALPPKECGWKPAPRAEDDDIPLNRDSGSAPCRSYAALIFESDSTWNALDTTTQPAHVSPPNRTKIANRNALLKASSAPGAPFLSGCKANASYSERPNQHGTPPLQSKHEKYGPSDKPS